MTPFKDSGNLALQRDVPADGNPFNPDRVQVSDSPRGTEEAAFLRMLYGDGISATYTPTMNGQIVDTRTMLMCSKCCVWKKDAQFARDRTRIIRRGRRYYCQDCLKHMRH